MLDTFQGFVHELRAAGLPVSMTENLDAMRAIEHAGMADRAALREALAATMVKHHHHRRAFDTLFDVYFALVPEVLLADAVARPDGEPLDAADAATAEGQGQPGLGGAPLTKEKLGQLLLAALAAHDRDELRWLVARAVDQFAGIEPGRPVGGTYYLYRTLRAMDVDGLETRLLAGVRERIDALEPLAERLAADDVQARVAELRALVEAEIRRRLVADRGAEAMARTVRRAPLEDVDFMHATREELAMLQRAIAPLARALAARLAQRRRRRHHGHLDFRRTVRASLSYGGVPAEPKFRAPHPAKPEIMVIADISGSVASFARFTLQFVYAIASQFSKVRSWAFIDGLDEVTRFFRESDDAAEAVRRVNVEADVVWADGHSDYGHALQVFHERHITEVTHKTSVILLGDARNNYHESHAWVVEEIARRARRVYWLDPEPEAYWDTGDSIVAAYAPYCDGVFECRSLRQLSRFVATVAEA